ncbi:MAG: AraC family transcriptional regulator [Peptostreptococcaceae bacterium]|jgi:AraC-like DNA-binding protein/mannose-6-phosphate isomerase-like protein (cupin superfamily)|nr:AraC family transcriptional regulator [Peptostreptococcaceae bacterium]
MNNIKRINYKENKKNEMADFEIVDLKRFFQTRSKKLLERDHRLNFWVIIYIINGEGKHYIDFKSFEYKSGNIIFVRKNQIHHFLVNENVNGYVIHINEPFMLKLSDYNNDVFWEFIDRSYGYQIIKIDMNEESNNRKLIDMIYKEYLNFSESTDENFIRSLFESFILSIRQQLDRSKLFIKTSEYEIFAKYRFFVEKHFRQQLNLDSYSKMLGVSKKTINLASRSNADLSAKEFINQRLLLEIKRYLSQGELMIYEISDILGFSEPANMTKFFKRYEKISPKKFKALNKKN